MLGRKSNAAMRSFPLFTACCACPKIFNDEEVTKTDVVIDHAFVLRCGDWNVVGLDVFEQRQSSTATVRALNNGAFQWLGGRSKLPLFLPSKREILVDELDS